jgi:hypothetical protein
MIPFSRGMGGVRLSVLSISSPWRTMKHEPHPVGMAAGMEAESAV